MTIAVDMGRKATKQTKTNSWDLQKRKGSYKRTRTAVKWD